MAQKKTLTEIRQSLSKKDSQYLLKKFKEATLNKVEREEVFQILTRRGVIQMRKSLVKRDSEVLMKKLNSNEYCKSENAIIRDILTNRGVI